MIIERELVKEITARYNKGEGLKYILAEKGLSSHDYYHSKDFYDPKTQNQIEKNIKVCKRIEQRLFELIELYQERQTHPDSKKRLSGKIDNLLTFYSKASPLELKDVMCPQELLR